MSTRSKRQVHARREKTELVKMTPVQLALVQEAYATAQLFATLAQQSERRFRELLKAHVGVDVETQQWHLDLQRGIAVLVQDRVVAGQTPPPPTTQEAAEQEAAEHEHADAAD